MKLNHFNAANELLRSGKVEEAIASYREAIALNPNFYWSHHNLGEALAKQNLVEEAVASYRKAIELNPNSLISCQQLGEIFYKLADDLTSESASKFSLHQIDAIFKQATNHLEVESFVREAYRTYIQNAPDESGKNYWLQQLGSGILSREHLLGELRKSKKYSPCVVLKSAYVQEAIACFDKAIAIDPQSAWSYFYLGEALAKKGDLEAAVTSYQQAIELQSEQSLFRARLSEEAQLKTILEQSDVWSIQNLDLAIQAELDNGYENAQQNNFDGAWVSWQRAIAFAPDRIETYLFIGYYLGNCGRTDAAVNIFQEYYQKQRKFAELHGVDKLGIRFVDPHNAVSAIGHIGLLDYYVKMSLLGCRSQHRTILLTPPNHTIANSHYLKYWQRYVQIISDPVQVARLSQVVRYSSDFFFATPTADKTLLYFQAETAVQKQWEAEGRGPLLTLSDADFEPGKRTLEALGMPENAWFVCLHVRESGYHKSLAAIKACHNADIDTYGLAIETIVKRGGWVVRLGDSSMTPLAPMEGVIDYAHSSVKSEWMDVFLCAAGRFFLGSTSGLCYVPASFGVPCALTNWACMGIQSPYGKDIFIPKLYWSETLERYLTLEEAMSAPYGPVNNSRLLSALGVRLADNAPEEIRDLTVEMLARLDGTIHCEASDDLLQAQFFELRNSCQAYGNCRIGRDFLRKYAGLLSKATEGASESKKG
ncbi:TIGR04372 family glycosyltransferase [Microcoleus sp. ARI1-B5]|uniref:TIGR04372 family glycosyltransferase n=1 Tax=unclassified Microcoleus TaxID=2642155 RepID=UPI002FD16F7E